MGKNDKKPADKKDGGKSVGGKKGGKGESEDKGGKAKGAQSINVRHILVSAGLCRGFTEISSDEWFSARSMERRRRPWPRLGTEPSLTRLRGSSLKTRPGKVRND